MIQSNNLRTGMSIIHEGNLYEVMATSQNSTAQRQMIIKAKARDMRSGSITELTFIGGNKIELGHIDKREMQYLYDAQDAIVFMDEENYEQIEVPKDQLEWELNFMKEGMIVTVIFYQSEILGVELAEQVSLKITQTEPAVRGNSTGNPQKDAVVETGYEIRVPLFVNQDEHVYLSTKDGKYQGRA